MAAVAQVEANRANAQKSTGPRTPAGKAQVAQNALKHGLFARETVIRGEDQDEFEMFRENLLSQLIPGSPLEEILGERIVDLTWHAGRKKTGRPKRRGCLPPVRLWLFLPGRPVERRTYRRPRYPVLTPFPPGGMPVRRRGDRRRTRRPKRTQFRRKFQDEAPRVKLANAAFSHLVSVATLLDRGGAHAF